MAKHHEWEDSKSGIRKHYKKILYPTMGVALVGTTTAAVALPIMIKKIATERTMDILSKILPIGGPENSLKDNEWVQKKDGRVNYLAIGDSVTAGYNGYMSRNDVIQDDVIAHPHYATSTNPGAEEGLNGQSIDPSNTIALINELKDIETELKKTTLTPEQRKALEQRKDFISLYMEDHAQHTTSDYLSYADFIANTLAKNKTADGKPILNDYRNFALTGATVPSLRQTLMRNTTALAAVQDADLITLSIGANDLLAAVEVLRLGWNAIRGQVETDRVSQFNAARDAIKRITDANSETRDDNLGRTHGSNPDYGWRTASASGYASEWDTKDLIRKSFNKLVNMLDAGTLGGLFDVQQQLLDAIFDLIQLDVATAVNELHQAAPQAKIVVMGYAFPFHLLPKSLTEDPIFQYNEKAISTDRTPRVVDGKQVSLKDVFMHTVDTIKETVERANYAKFFDINQLKEFQEGSDKVTYNLLKDDNIATDQVVTRPEWSRVMPNPLDIHPSTYGHQVIAGHLFEWIAQDLGLTVPKYESIQKIANFDPATSQLDDIYTYANPDTPGLYKDQGFVIRDEKAAYDSDSLISMIDNLNNKFYLRIFGAALQKVADPNAIADHYNDLMNGFKALDFDSKNIGKTVDDVYKLIKPVLNVNAPFGNVPGYTVGKFFDKLVDIVKGVHWDKVDFDKKSKDGTTDTNGILNDVIEVQKGDGIQLVELIAVFAIYLGDKGDAFTVESMDVNDTTKVFPAFTIPAHDAPTKNDQFFTEVKNQLTANNKEYFANSISLLEAGKKVDISGDATLRMLTNILPMNIGAPDSGGTYAYLNLAKPDAQGHRVPWMDPATGEIHFAEVLDEITALGKDLGMDISSYSAGLTKDQKSQLLYSFWVGDHNNNIYVNMLLATSGINMYSQKFWQLGGADSILNLATKAGVDINGPIDEVYDKIAILSANN